MTKRSYIEAVSDLVGVGGIDASPEATEARQRLVAEASGAAQAARFGGEIALQCATIPEGTDSYLYKVSQLLALDPTDRSLPTVALRRDILKTLTERAREIGEE